MAQEIVTNLGIARRFGPRYGRTIKYKLAAIETEQKKKHKCPYCNALRVRRITYGVWTCGKCDKTFTGRAYTPVSLNPEIVQTIEKKETIEIKEQTPAQEEEGDEEVSTYPEQTGVVGEMQEPEEEEQPDG